MPLKRVYKSLVRPCAIALLGIFLLTGCSLKTMYTYSDWALLWYLDDYFDLNSEQRDTIDTQFAGHLKWHQQEELANYRVFLEQVKEKVADGLAPKELDWGFDQFQQFRMKLFRRFSSDSAAFLVSLENSQIDYLEEQLPEGMEQLQEWIAMPYEEYLQNRAEHTIENIEDWVGELNSAQIAEITQMSKNFPVYLQDHLNHRKKSNKAFVSLLRSTKDKEIIEKQLLHWYVDQKDYYSDDYAEKRKIAADASAQMILKIEKMLTQPQRDHFIEKIDEYITEIQEIRETGSI